MKSASRISFRSCCLPCTAIQSNRNQSNSSINQSCTNAFFANLAVNERSSNFFKQRLWTPRKTIALQCKPRQNRDWWIEETQLKSNWTDNMHRIFQCKSINQSINSFTWAYFRIERESSFSIICNQFAIGTKNNQCWNAFQIRTRGIIERNSGVTRLICTFDFEFGVENAFGFAIAVMQCHPRHLMTSKQGNEGKINWQRESRPQQNIFRMHFHLDPSWWTRFRNSCLLNKTRLKECTIDSKRITFICFLEILIESDELRCCLATRTTPASTELQRNIKQIRYWATNQQISMSPEIQSHVFSSEMLFGGKPFVAWTRSCRRWLSGVAHFAVLLACGILESAAGNSTNQEETTGNSNKHERRRHALSNHEMQEFSPRRAVPCGGFDCSQDRLGIWSIAHAASLLPSSILESALQRKKAENANCRVEDHAGEPSSK